MSKTKSFNTFSYNQINRCLYKTRTMTYPSGVWPLTPLLLSKSSLFLFYFLFLRFGTLSVYNYISETQKWIIVTTRSVIRLQGPGLLGQVKKGEKWQAPCVKVLCVMKYTRIFSAFEDPVKVRLVNWMSEETYLLV